jgi:hypothetical protein
MSQEEKEDSLPVGEGADVKEVLDGLVKLEGRYVFGCGHCDEIFETVREVGEHSLAEHSGRMLLIDPVRKQ